MMPETMQKTSGHDDPQSGPTSTGDVHIHVASYPSLEDMKIPTRGTMAGAFGVWTLLGLVGLAAIILKALGRGIAGINAQSMSMTIAFWAVVYVVGGVWLVVWLFRLYRAKSKYEPGEWRSDPSYRVRFIGPREAYDRLGPIEDEAFEPELFYAFLAARLTKGQIAVWVMTTTAFYVLMFFSGVTNFAMMGGLVFWTPFSLGMIATALLWPTYIRVVPGRLDVLAYPILGSGAPALHSYDLRSMQVIAMPMGVVRLFEKQDDQDGEEEAKAVKKALVLTTSLPWDHRRYARAVLRGAISTAPVPGARASLDQ
jgi:hypothetical protein